MLHPVGSQPPAVYWRRRLVAVAFAVTAVVLLALTAQTVLGGGGEPAAAGAPGHHSGVLASDRADAPTTGAADPDGTAGPRQRSDSDRAATDTSHPAGASATRTTAPPAGPTCTPGQLAIKAVAGRGEYAVGAHPVLTLQVTNTGPKPCVQDVADPQIVLRVYNGASRVWGSHDCKIEPGVTDRTLEPDQPAGFSIVWSGLSSQPHCAGTRQRVGAGTYTLVPALSGHQGKATTFTIS
jgi:hypothetical protein